MSTRPLLSENGDIIGIETYLTDAEKIRATRILDLMAQEAQEAGDYFDDVALAVLRQYDEYEWEDRLTAQKDIETYLERNRVTLN